ncbi:hypothetical protein RN347_12415 [Halomonas sp. PAMB 3264]|uniref:hypothetical protein n=1 Tax=Halomonas sp. PAMB 3264 TaxID=3075222 RepID=UPI00289D5E49|nr:hypothetical protein [Halomonas sp. PAMB 3264]WNL41419.1 hypothetical protein RN347_12415 [Halomonas sp. PAMB 3264]
MVPYIQETLNFLDKTDFKINYPDINHVILKEEKDREIHMAFACNFSQNNHLNKNENLKFIITFSMLDVFADTVNPESEGKSFRQKYQSLPKTNDYEIIFSGLYRIAKVIRNAMVHNPNGIDFDHNKLCVKYVFKSTMYSMTLSKRVLDDFYTLIVMYVKGDLGKGEYFLALAREIYERIVSNLQGFSDDLPGLLPLPDGKLKIRSARREIIINPLFEIEDSTISFSEYKIDFPEWAGADFSIEIDGVRLLIPQEALNSENRISISSAKRDWEAINLFPVVPENL